MAEEAAVAAATAEKIKGFIEENFLYGEPFALGESDSLLEEGILDSTGVLQLVTFLEREYGIKVEDEELVPDNLDTLAGILGFIARKRAGE
jgi:acyl carrier protein